jgi:hypothetical protein
MSRKTGSVISQMVAWMEKDCGHVLRVPFDRREFTGS